ncbi:hypothetical protein SH449x_001697 [Pirellulaceae bacterium SH449]
MKLFKTPAFWLLAVALTIVVLANWNNESASRGRAHADEGKEALGGAKLNEGSSSRTDNVIREGTELSNLRVQVRRAASGRINLFDEQTKRTMVCLENLWLQRILTAQKNDDPGVIWIISGRVTEFDGANFFQIVEASRSN